MQGGPDSIVLCYAAGDEAFARRLALFLEINLPVAVSCSEGVVGPDLDLIEATERALSAEVAFVLLSPLSVPKIWNRKTWEPVFFAQPKEFQTHLGFVLVNDCTFPGVLRRERFFDASRDWMQAAREMKRWLLRPLHNVRPVEAVAPDLEDIRRAVSDQPGAVVEIAPELAVRFADECAEDFEGVYRFDCRDRSRAGIVGDIGSALGLHVSGRMDENRATLHAWCTTHRVLFILAGVKAEDRDFATPGGRASVIFVHPVTCVLPGSITSVAGDAVRRFEQTAGIPLGWIAVRLLSAQERFAEVAELLEAMANSARDRGDKTALLRIEREQYWLQNSDDGRILAQPDPGQEVQLSLPFM